jgi:DNA mismatch endonuclease, patch repair protein
MDTLSPGQRSKLMSRIRGRDTAPELLVRSMAHRLGFRFRLQRKDLAGKPDLVFPGKAAVVFVHGCFWHGHDCNRGCMPTSNRPFWEHKIGSNKERDYRVQKQLEDEGWRVLTIWQCDIKDLAGLRRRLIAFLTETQNERNDARQ